MRRKSPELIGGVIAELILICFVVLVSVIMYHLIGFELYVVSTLGIISWRVVDSS